MYKKNARALLCGLLFVVLSAVLLLNCKYEIKQYFGFERIHSVEDEFLAQSSALRAEVWKYKVFCAPHLETCDTKSYFKRRDVLVAMLWPKVYDRLKKYSNWGDGRLTRPNRDTFFKETNGFTPYKLRNEWVPVLQYDHGRLVLGTCDSTPNDKRRFVPKKIIDAGLCK